MTKNKKQKVIGITIFVNQDGGLGLYENGLRQNVIFLYQLFRNLKGFKVYLLNHGDGILAEDASIFGIDERDIVSTPEVETLLDYVICIGAGIDVQTMARMRARGTKLICYKGGNGGVISMEAVASNPIRHDAERYYDVGFYDAIWMTPQHIHTYKGWCETIYRCPVYEVPQIWAPTFINCRPKEIVDKFQYHPGTTSKRVVIMDPNITIMKTSHVPILVAESAYRKSPDLFQSLYVSNAIRLANDPHFNSFCSSMSIFKNGVATVEPRFAGADFLANHADALVTHHWENGLNYLYYEALYGGYPLIHNSQFIREYGYYYPDFDAISGGEILLFALKNHDSNLLEYRKKSRQLLQQRHPNSDVSVEAHLSLLGVLN